MKRLTVAMALMMLTVLLVPAATGEDVIERYRGFAVAMGSVAAGAKSSVEIGIFRWTTDEERASFLSILEEKGSDALHEAMFEGEQVAFMKISGSMGYKLRFAREFVDDKGVRHIILASDRPISMQEMRQSTATEDYNFSIIELAVDSEGRGEGAIALGVAVGWNKEKDVLELEGYSSEPMRLMNVSRAK